jgi:hypothetical protein
MKTALTHKVSAVSFCPRIGSHSIDENLSELATKLPFQFE